MPHPRRQPRCPAVALLASGDPEHAQVRVWRPVSDAWPPFAPRPTLKLTRLDSALADPSGPFGDAVLLVVRAHDRKPRLHVLLDRLASEGLPCVALCEDAERDAPALASSGVVALPLDAPPQQVAIALATLVKRQETVSRMARELSVARRFQGGLAGEMDKIHEELQLAASVQREFLPKSLPELETLDFRVLFRPCGYVSGDIYDVQRLDEHRVGFFVADAVGHGVPAALMTMVLARSFAIKGVVRSGGEITPPGDVLAALNQEMIQRHGDTPRFATAVYGVADTRDRSVRLAGAGHPPPLRLAPSGVREVETEGGLLGVFPDAEFSESAFTLAPEEMLLIYSDGFETAFPNAQADQRERRIPTRHYLDHFADVAARWTSKGINHAMHELAEALDQQSGSLHQIDDLTVMALVPRAPSPLDPLFHARVEETPPPPPQRAARHERTRPA